MISLEDKVPKLKMPENPGARRHRADTTITESGWVFYTFCKL